MLRFRHLLTSIVRDKPNTTIQYLLSILIAASLSAITTLIWSVSCSNLIFAGSLASNVSVGITLALISNIIVGIFVALRTSLPGLVTSVQEAPIAILSVVSSEIFTDVTVINVNEQLYTVLAIAIITGLLSGMTFWLIGKFRLGSLVRYIPYPVMGGFLAGVGWLLVAGTINRHITNISSGGQGMSLLSSSLEHWLPELLLGLILVALLRHTKNALVFPIVIATSILGFYLVLWGTGTSIAEARLEGWLLEDFAPQALSHSMAYFHVTNINWNIFIQQLPQLLTITLLCSLGLLLNISGVEIALNQDIDLNHELKVTGAANMLAGMVGGGLTSYVSLSRTILNYRLNAPSRMVGCISSGLCIFVLFGHISTLSLLPQPLIGGMTVFLGINFLIEWLYDGWFNLSKSDYWLVWLIVLSITVWGLVQGVVIGFIVAMILFVIKTSRHNVIKQTFSLLNYPSHVQRSAQEQFLLKDNGRHVYIIQLQGWLFFGNSHQLFNHVRDRLQQLTLETIQYLIIDFRLVNGLDSSATFSFIKLKQLVKKHHLQLVFAHLQPKILAKLDKKGCLGDNATQVFTEVNQGIAWCEEKILESDELVKINKRQADNPEQEPCIAYFFPSIRPNQLIPYLEKIEIEPKDFLFYQGQMADGMYFLASGQVSVIREYDNEQSKCLRTYTSQTIIGEMGMYTQSQRSASIIADLPSKLYFLSTIALVKMENESPRLAAAVHKLIVELLIERLHYREQEMHNLID